MKALITIIRVLAVLLGLLWLGSTSLDILGFIPYSQATPPLAQRIAHSVPLLASGALFLLPYRVVRSPALRLGLAGALILVVGWAIYLSIDGVAGYFTGAKSWHIVPVALLFSAVAVGNAWAFMRITGLRALGRRPGEKTPSRDRRRKAAE